MGSNVMGMRTIFETTDLISGSGGQAKGGGSTPTEATSMTVKEYVRLFVVMCEGPIHGVPQGKTYNNVIFLNKTPLVNPTSGEANFQGYKVLANLGTPGQPNINPMKSLSFPVPVGARLVFGSPTLKTIERSDANVIRIVLSTQRFASVDNKGNISAVEVPFKFEVSSNGGPYQQIVSASTGVIKSDSYVWSYDYLLTPFGPPPYTIRVSRLSPNSTTDKLANDLVLARIDEFVPTSTNYEGLACAYAAFAAENFGNSVPEVSVLQEGLVLSVPHNYIPSNRFYNGTFSGSLVPAPTVCDNPAWFLYRLLTSTVYGRGIPANRLDVFSFYDLARYCDQLVSDGQGGLEPRYRFNAYINQQGQAEDVIDAVLATCRARMYDSNGALALVYDRPVSTISYIFNPAMVIGGGFQFQAAPVTSCYTTVSVTWFDPSQSYEPRTVTVTDPTLKTKFGDNVTKMTSMGCTSRGQAIRLARWTIYSSCLQRKLMSVKLGPESYWLAPGNRVKAQTNRLVAGRLFDNGALDRKVTAPTGSIIAYDKTDGTVGQLTLTSPINDSITVTGMVDGAKNGGFVISDPTAQTDWVIIGIEDDVITCLLYDESKFSKIETFSQTNLSTPIFNYPVLTPPKNLKATESLYQDRANIVLVRLNLLWGQPDVIDGLAFYEVSYRKVTESNFTTFLVKGTNATIDNLEPTEYQIRVRSLSRNGPSKFSQYTSVQSIIVGLKEPPKVVTNLTIDSYTSTDVRLSWDKATDLDVIQGGRIEIRLGTNWQTATVVNLYIAGSATTAILPVFKGTYSLKTVDSSGNYSNGTATVESTFVDTDKTVLLLDSKWGGTDQAWNIPGTTVSNCVISGGDLVLNTGGTFNTKGIFNTSGIFNSSPPPIEGVVEGFWTSPVFTVNPVNPTEFNANLQTQWLSSINTNTFNKKGVINNSGIWNGPTAKGTVTQELRASLDGVTFAPFQLWATGRLKAKYWQYRLKLRRENSNETCRVSNFRAILSLDTRTETRTSNSLAGSDGQVFFTNPFFSSVSISATIVNPSPGDYFQLVSSTIDSFIFSVRNSAGTRIVKDIQWTASGFGKVV